MPLPMYKKSGKSRSSGPIVLAIAAGKGGVGKSSVAVNLALALKEEGFSVGLVDTDVYGPSVRRMLPEDRLPAQSGEKMKPALSFGVETMSMAFFRREGQAAVMRAPIANSLVAQFLKQVEWGALDFLVIDFPPGTGDVQLTLGQQANLAGAVLVTTPQEIALMDVRKAANMFDQVKVPIVGVVENMSYLVQSDGTRRYVFGRDGGKRLADELGVPLLGRIPLDSEFARACDEGKPLVPLQPEHAVSKVFFGLAQNVRQHLELLHQASSDRLSRFELKWEKEPSGAGLGVSDATEESNLESLSDAVFIRGIRQTGPQSFAVAWSDGAVEGFQLASLQRQCPCAACVDEFSGKRVRDPSTIPDDLGASRVASVGRYAIRIDFSSGCSNGIYSYDFLRQLAASKRPEGVCS